MKIDLNSNIEIKKMIGLYEFKKIVGDREFTRKEFNEFAKKHNITQMWGWGYECCTGIKNEKSYCKYYNSRRFFIKKCREETFEMTKTNSWSGKTEKFEASRYFFKFEDFDFETYFKELNKELKVTL